VTSTRSLGPVRRFGRRHHLLSSKFRGLHRSGKKGRVERPPDFCVRNRQPLFGHQSKKWTKCQSKIPKPAGRCPLLLDRRFPKHANRPTRSNSPAAVSHRGSRAAIKTTVHFPAVLDLSRSPLGRSLAPAPPFVSPRGPLTGTFPAARSPVAEKCVAPGGGVEVARKWALSILEFISDLVIKRAYLLLPMRGYYEAHERANGASDNRGKENVWPRKPAPQLVGSTGDATDDVRSAAYPGPTLEQLRIELHQPGGPAPNPRARPPATGSDLKRKGFKGPGTIRRRRKNNRSPSNRC